MIAARVKEKLFDRWLTYHVEVFTMINNTGRSFGITT